MGEMKDLLINEGDYLFLGSLIVDGEIRDRSFQYPVEVLAIDPPLVKIKTPYGYEHCVSLHEYPNYRKISNKTIPQNSTHADFGFFYFCHHSNSTSVSSSSQSFKS